jgi:hypothetical protein
LLASCASLEGGSSTTDRPALTRPAIEPDGAFWDAAVVAERGDTEAFLYLLSPQMVYRALYPENELDEISDQEGFDKQRKEIDEELKPHQAVIEKMAKRYMSELRKLLRDKFIEVSKPTYSIRYKGKYDRATGPNTARVTVTIYPKQALPKGFKPERMEVSFIQDRRRWLIDNISNDKLKGAFVR